MQRQHKRQWEPFKNVHLPFYNHLLIAPSCLDCQMCTYYPGIKLLWIPWRSEGITLLHNWEIGHFASWIGVQQLQNEQKWITLLQCYYFSFSIMQICELFPIIIFLHKLPIISCQRIRCNGWESKIALTSFFTWHGLGVKHCSNYKI